jgi:hypothetical protein
MFKERKHTTLIYGVPTVRIYQRALRKMWNWVQCCDIEVGWLGCADMCDDGNLLITDVFLPDQDCHSTTTELTPEGIADLGMKLMGEDDAANIPVDSPDYRANKLLFWGHSHINMGVSPSGQDDDQMRQFTERDWFIRGIFNKKGDAEFFIYYFKTGFIIKDASWEAVDDPNDESVKIAEKEVKDRVTRMGYTTYQRDYSKGGWQGQDWYDKGRGGKKKEVKRGGKK